MDTMSTVRAEIKRLPTRFASLRLGLALRRDVWCMKLLRAAKRLDTLTQLLCGAGFVALAVGLPWKYADDLLLYWGIVCKSLALHWHQHPVMRSFTLTLVICLAIVLVIRCLRVWASYDAHFRLATCRLSDDVPINDRALSINTEAMTMSFELQHGRRNPELYRFLVDLWKPHLSDDGALSLLTISDDNGAKHRLPIALLKGPDIDSLIDCDLLHVHRASRFREYSTGEQTSAQGGTVPAGSDELAIRNPMPRFLRRFKGAKSSQTGFRDDYCGYNVALQSMEIGDGRLACPIEGTLELYGNALDSCDSLIEELYLHFSFQRQRTDSIEDVLALLPLRRRLHAMCENDVKRVLTHAPGRASAFGVAALTVFNRDDTFVAIRGTRSSAIGTYPDVYHVIPAGMTNINPEGDAAFAELTGGDFLNSPTPSRRQRVCGTDWSHMTYAETLPIFRCMRAKRITLVALGSCAKSVGQLGVGELIFGF